MNFATFCCLMAFYAFEIVHAGDECNSDLESAIIKYETDTSDYAEKKRKIITAFCFEKQKPDCLDKFEIALSPIQTRTKNCMVQCANDARKNVNIQVANSCGKAIYKTLKKDVDNIVLQAVKCIYKK